MTKSEEIREGLDNLALDLLEEAKGESIKLDQKLDTFKVVSTYHVNMTRVLPKPLDPPEEGFSMDAARRAIEESESVGTESGPRN